MSFAKVIIDYSPTEIRNLIYSATPKDVEKALSSASPNIKDFAALLSPAAEAFLEPMTALSHQKTLKRFGKTVQLFIPLYLSNFCENNCVYCGFSSKNSYHRTVLTEEQILDEVRILKDYGYEHLLLVTGEAPKKAGMDYFRKVLLLLRSRFSLLSFEVQPLEQNEYEELIELGLHTVYIYQETYDRQLYQHYHTHGKKADYLYRLETPDRLGKAGIKRIGLGSLLGLGDWRVDSFFTALHLKYLEKTYWKTKYSISFPRLRPHVGSFQPQFPMSDKQLIQLICAYRIFDEEVELSISVRESAKFRDNAMLFGITSMSAGSKTQPGGYSQMQSELEQFEVHDNRSPQEIVAMIESKGYRAIWKDWDKVM